MGDALLTLIRDEDNLGLGPIPVAAVEDNLLLVITVSCMGQERSDSMLPSMATLRDNLGKISGTSLQEDLLWALFHGDKGGVDTVGGSIINPI